MADQVREAWIADSQEVALAVGGLPTTSLAHADTMRAIRSAWDAGAASHAAEVEALRSALEKAERRLFGAWQMLEAINEGDPSRDRKAAASRALDGLNEVRAALKGDKP